MASIEKTGTALDGLTNNSVFKKLQGYYNAYSEKRESLGLPNPGTIDNISKEVQRDVFTNNHSFSGLRAELTKAFSVAPMFQVCHALSMGSQQLQPYQYMVLYGSPKVCSVKARGSSSSVAKTNSRSSCTEPLTATSPSAAASTTAGLPAS